VLALTPTLDNHSINTLEFIMTSRTASLALVSLLSLGAVAHAQAPAEIKEPVLKGMRSTMHDGHRMREGMHGHMGLHQLFMGDGKHAAGHESEEQVDKMVGQWLDELKGTPEQRKKITAVVVAVRGELQPMRQHMHAQRQKAMDLMFANTLDTQALDKQHAEHTQLREKMGQRTHRAMVEVLQILTPAQRTQCKEKMQSHMSDHKLGARSGSGVRHHASPNTPTQR
jgi:Spy/CpxP family protein refolding chaperone